jgi:RNA polymerase sigma-70 factor, ECF subfamily
MGNKEKGSAMEVTELLRRLLVYTELKKLASAHLRGKARVLPLETTALVHEAFLKLSRSGHPCYENRTHFYGVASRVMRQVLVDVARSRFAEKRGAALEIPVAILPDSDVQPDRSLLALNDALQELEKVDSLKGQLIEMRYFGGLTAEESAAELSIPVHIVRRELRLAQAWLGREMSGSAGGAKCDGLDMPGITSHRAAFPLADSSAA